MNLGDRVACTAYIKSSGNYYEIINEKETLDGVSVSLYHERGDYKGVEIEDCHDCDRYRMIEKEFIGIYVGTTTLCTRLNVEWYEDPYCGTGYRTYCDEPKKFVVVYYADNKKRIVPIERATKIAQA